MAESFGTRPFSNPPVGTPRAGFLAVGAIIVLAIAFSAWKWEVERVEVAPGKFLVLVHRWGRNLAEGEIVAPDDSYKGVKLEPLTEGRQFINPIFWSYEIHDMVRVPVGQCLVRTRKFGQNAPPQPGDETNVLARENPKNLIDGERGILREVLTPGSYRINPHAYAHELVPAIEIRVDQVGVRSLMVGKDPKDLPPDEKRGNYVVPDGYRGIQQTTVPPGTYYINPYAEMIVPVEVRSHKVDLTDIQFPSRDGFLLQPRVVVEYAVQPEKAPEMLVRLTDEGMLHQKDDTPQDQLENEILQKVILPHVRGYARIEGSNFDARDFIVKPVDKPGQKLVNAREALQQSLLQKIKPRCEELGVEIRAVTLADMHLPVELSEQIAQRELARVELEKNTVRVRQYRTAQELAAKEALKAQAKDKVEAETRLLQAKTKAEQSIEVETSRLTQELANAQLQLDAAKNQAEAILSKGKAEAAVINLTNAAEVAGLRKAVQGFSGVQNFAQYHVVTHLAPALSEIFASDTSDFAKLFSGYMTAPTPTAAPQPSKAIPPPAAAADNGK
jgi:hypothetical protein